MSALSSGRAVNPVRDIATWVPVSISRTQPALLPGFASQKRFATPFQATAEAHRGRAEPATVGPTSVANESDCFGARHFPDISS